MAGFPSERYTVRSRFADLVTATGYTDVSASIRLLYLHQCVEGATVDPAKYTFSPAPDVIRASDIPRGFSAVLSGHIHRQQVLTASLRGRSLAAPVLYPGSIERTSIAEAAEEQGFMIVECTSDDDVVTVGWEFRYLPARPLVSTTFSSMA